MTLIKSDKTGNFLLLIFLVIINVIEKLLNNLKIN